MAKINDIKRARINYLQYVYEHYVRYIGMNENYIISKKMTMAAKKSVDDPHILEEYLKQVSKKEYSIAECFKDDHYESFIFIELKEQKMTLYSRDNDCIYHVYLSDKDDQLMLSTLNKFNELESVLMKIDNKYYLDVATFFPEKQKTFYNAYKLDKHIEELMK